MDQLQHNSLLKRDDLNSVPVKGVYVFYENGQPTYVGRSNNVRRRIQQHGRPSSGHNIAPFAFNLAKDILTKNEQLTGNETREELEQLPEFIESFSLQKQRVANMEVRVVSISDQIEQTLFEVYAALSLDTKYNDFATH
jgi:uncharacterized protein (UPF0297 family)